MTSRARSPRSDRILTAGLLLALVVVAAQITAHLADYAIYGSADQHDALNSGLDDSISAWVSIGALGAAALAGALAARSTGRRAPALLGLLASLLLAAEIADLRELPYSLLAFLPLVLALLALLFREALIAGGRAGGALAGGAGLLVLSFVFHELVPRVIIRLGYDYASWPHELKSAFKAGTEIGGWMIVAASLAAVAAAVGESRARRSPAV